MHGDISLHVCSSGRQWTVKETAYIEVNVSAERRSEGLATVVSQSPSTGDGPRRDTGVIFSPPHDLSNVSVDGAVGGHIYQ